MAGACIHGYTPGTCLICQSLETAKATETAERSKRPEIGTTKAALPARTRARTGLRSGPRVVPKEAPRTGSPVALKLMALVVGVVAVIVVGWTVLHLVFAALHILELVGVAVVAGYLGYQVGVHRGHKSARRD